MAAKKKVAGKKRVKTPEVDSEAESTPSPAASAGPSQANIEAALRRARELEEQNEALQAQLEALEERAEEADDPEEIQQQIATAKTATYDPTVYGLLRHEEISAILAHKVTLDRAAAEQIKALTERDAGLFTGMASFNSGAIDRQRADAETIAREREYANDWRMKATAAEMKLADMVRQSEDARLERERLAADVRRGEQALERLQMELDSKVRMRTEELTAMKQMALPIANVAATGLRAVIGHYAAGLGGAGGAPGPGAPMSGGPGLPGGAPGGPGPSPAAGPRYDVSLDGVDAFDVAFKDVYQASNNEAKACLRALMCSNLIPGAPVVPAPQILEMLTSQVMASAGQERIMKLLETCQQAYVVAPTPPPHANGAATMN